MIKNRIRIAECPEMVETKSPIGDQDADTVLGKNHKVGLLTSAERKSRYVLAEHILKHSEIG